MQSTRKIFSIDDLSDGDVGRLFFVAKKLEKCPETMMGSLKRRQIMLAFFEPSTRTKLSFAMACNRVGAHPLTFDSLNSSQIKGETKLDTLKTLAALGPDVLVIRQKELIDRENFDDLPIHMINAGDGTNEHPTQALLDCFTLLHHFGGDDLDGLKILICGDVGRSRVYHSNIKLMKRLGARVFVLVPPIFKSDGGESTRSDFARFEEIKEKFDAVMVLRVQEERMEQNVVDRKQYFRDYGLSRERFLALGPNCLLMHPGPMIDGAEIDGRLAEHARSLVLKQVRMGVVVRAAALSTLFSFGENHA